MSGGDCDGLQRRSCCRNMCLVVRWGKFMRTRFLAVVASIAILSSTAAAAKAEDSKSGAPVFIVPPEENYTASMTKEDAARLQAERVAACVVNARREMVLKGIQREPWEPSAHSALDSALDAKCLGNSQLVMPADLLRGAYFQELYRERFTAAWPTLAATPIDFAGKGAGTLTDEAKTDIALLQFGDCVARRDLGDVHQLILSLPGSPQETNALSALVPHFDACLVRGSKWTLDKSSITGLLSEVVYREAVASTEGIRN